MPHTSVALTAQYLNVRQRKLGTIIIQTVQILQHERADTGSLPMEDFFKHNPNLFQITLAGSSTAVTPPYQWRRTRGDLICTVVATPNLVGVARK
jgi:hypothetical protein